MPAKEVRAKQSLGAQQVHWPKRRTGAAERETPVVAAGSSTPRAKRQRTEAPVFPTPVINDDLDPGPTQEEALENLMQLPDLRSGGIVSVIVNFISNKIFTNFSVSK
jgi:hypothetical protein